ncbi:MAG: hypothetical protein ACYTGV_00040 [Planctomycetota bacterium]|jgi:hypothetical protein
MAEGTPESAPPAPESTHVIVRAYPKIVYLYLTWIASIICYILQPSAEIVGMDDNGVQYVTGNAGLGFLLGRIWMAIFVFNLLVIAFEFSRIRSVAIAFFVVAVVFAGIQLGFLEGLGQFLGGLELLMNKVFYMTIAVIFSIMYLLVFINTRFNYWEIQPNEILHHHGFLGDVHRYPTRGLRMKKEISDVLEFILLRAGTLVLDPHGEERPLVLENVINLNKVEDKIQRLLGTLKVRLDKGEIGGID